MDLLYEVLYIMVMYGSTIGSLTCILCGDSYMDLVRDSYMCLLRQKVLHGSSAVKKSYTGLVQQVLHGSSAVKRLTCIYCGESTKPPISQSRLFRASGRVSTRLVASLRV